MNYFCYECSVTERTWMNYICNKRALTWICPSCRAKIHDDTTGVLSAHTTSETQTQETINCTCCSTKILELQRTIEEMSAKLEILHAAVFSAESQGKQNGVKSNTAASGNTIGRAEILPANTVQHNIRQLTNSQNATYSSVMSSAASGNTIRRAEIPTANAAQNSIQQPFSSQNTTYASVLSTAYSSGSTTAPYVHSVIPSKLYDDVIREQRERKRRERNVLIRGMRNQDSSSMGASLERLFWLLTKRQYTFEFYCRGEPKDDSTRNVVVQFSDTAVRSEILRNSKTLRNTEWSNIYISPDLTLSQASFDYELRKQLKELKAKDTSKNYFIKKGRIRVAEISANVQPIQPPPPPPLGLRFDPSVTLQPQDENIQYSVNVENSVTLEPQNENNIQYLVNVENSFSTLEELPTET